MPESASPAGPAWARAIATVGGLGHARPGPGTWGSCGTGVVLYLLVISLPAPWVLPALVGVAVFLATVGTWAVHHLLTSPGNPLKDPPWVVVDEALGVSLALLVIPTGQTIASPCAAITLAVLMFRVLDIAKPAPLGHLERLPGALGVMADDAAAGLLAGLAVAVLWT